MDFERDADKDSINQSKHTVSFAEAQFAFMAPHRLIALDHVHSTPQETRYFCFGKVEGQVLTVRFTYRESRVRIFGAGCWREGRKRYEQREEI